MAMDQSSVTDEDTSENYPGSSSKEKKGGLTIVVVVLPMVLVIGKTAVGTSSCVDDVASLRCWGCWELILVMLLMILWVVLV